ncbi:MAG: hypothetical protein M3539_02250 [Acidobacteriota bacterium]|nr:hypothetical protein [Acidobacteriota bacterium]
MSETPARTFFGTLHRYQAGLVGLGQTTTHALWKMELIKRTLPKMWGGVLIRTTPIKGELAEIKH